MRKCLFFFLGLIAALFLAVMAGLNSGEAKPQVLQASIEAEAAQSDALASEIPQKPAVKRILPETKVP